MCKKFSLDRKKIFVHNYKLLNIQLRFKMSTENLIDIENAYTLKYTLD